MKILILGASSDIGLELLGLLDKKGIELGAHCFQNDRVFKKFQNSNFSKFKIFKKNLSSEIEAKRLFKSYINWSKEIEKGALNIGYMRTLANQFEICGNNPENYTHYSNNTNIFLSFP